MKPLRKRLAYPIILMSILIPVVILLVFNLTMRVAIQRSMANELTTVVDNIRRFSEQITLNDTDSSEEPLSESNLQRLTLARSALQVSRFAMNTEMLILTEQGTILFPRDLSTIAVTQKVIQTMHERSTDPDTLTSFTVNGHRYQFIYDTLQGPVREYRIYYLASAGSMENLVRFMNGLLVIIVVISAGIAIAWALSLARRISAPLLSAAKATQQIADGQNVHLTSDSQTEEVQVLLESFNRMSHKLQAAEATQRDFLQNASHELRTPLMSIQGYAEGLSQGVFTQTKEIADQIAKESKRLTALVEEILMLSRLESAQYTAQLSRRDLNDVIPELIDRMQGIAVSASKHVVFKSTDRDLWAKVDESLVYHAVTNVLSNALRYAHSTVTVTLSAQNTKVTLVIHDDGPGIDPADLPHLFQRFHKGKGGQFGLGLAIAKSAMTVMDGEITVTNDHGARFELSWPHQ